MQEDGTTVLKTTNWRPPGEAHAGQPYEWTGQTVFLLREHAEMDPTFDTQPKENPDGRGL